MLRQFDKNTLRAVKTYIYGVEILRYFITERQLTHIAYYGHSILTSSVSIELCTV